MIRRRRLAAFACALLAAAPLAPASGDDDEDKAAEAALARGDAQPVHALLQRVRSNFAGSVLKIEMEHEDGEAPWVYEVKLLTPRGNVLELRYDAASLELIGLEGRYRENED